MLPSEAFTPFQLQIIDARIADNSSRIITEYETARNKEVQIKVDRKGFLTTAEVAERFDYKISAETIANYCQNGVLLAMKPSKSKRGMWLVDENSVNEFIARTNRK